MEENPVFSDMTIVQELGIGTISNLILGALIFVTVVAWSEVFRVFFDEKTDEERDRSYYRRLNYAIFMTGFTIVVGIIIYFSAHSIKTVL